MCKEVYHKKESNTNGEGRRKRATIFTYAAPNIF